MSECTCKPEACLVEVPAGLLLWCYCGRSGHLPFCDFSHRGSGRVPKKYHLQESRTLPLCRCQKTGTPPLCENLPAEDMAAYKKALGC